MALSDERIWGSDAIMKANAAASLPIPILRILCHSVEAEARKDDTALIRQMAEALDTAFHQTCSVGRPKDWEQIRNALHSARARLGGKP